VKKEIADESIEQEAIPFLHEIAERLRTGHASVMVGAGFSKNALRSSKTQIIPDWNELIDRFYEKLNAGCEKNVKKEYLNPLKLASEIEAAYGRSTLNNIIKSSIPDHEYQPSELHKKMLNLPWIDVFTTNYDTLLERAAESIIQFRYEPVINIDDLVWSTKPRIIKLHGSFPSERPFIITEEDYRTYPSKYTPFVNTVQQSLLENTLCLIGFSGHDPNFLNWIGWIRDNLGTENLHKMYLIGVLDLSNAQKKLLQDRCIVPIDISFYSKNHYDAFSHFFDFLLKQCQNDDALKWPEEEYVHFDSSMDKLEFEMKKAVKMWENTREKYPNWLIMPYNRRVSLQQLISNTNFIHYVDEAKEPLDIIILYEFNWRLEKSFYPLLSAWLPIYRSVLDKYNPYQDELETSDIHEIDRDRIKTYWVEINLSLLSFYRYNGMDNDWDLLSCKLETISNLLPPEQNAKYHYERCLKKLFALDFPALREEIKAWVINSPLPYWEAKKAGLIAETSDLNIAKSILEASLIQVRNNLFLNPVKDDYYNISQEAYILQLLSYVQDSIRFINQKYSQDDERDKYRKRWQEIVKYECDPWGEVKQYEALFKLKAPPYTSTEKVYGFNIGHYSIHQKWGNDEYTLKAYSFLKYMEEAGIPLKLSGISFNNEVSSRVVERIVGYWPKWAFVTFIRIADVKNVSVLFDRKSLISMSQEDVDDLSKSGINILQEIIITLDNENSDNKNSFSINMAKIIPQTLAHLCVKNSFAVKKIILSVLKNIYSLEKRNIFENVSMLTENLINSFSNKEQQQLFSAFFEFPIIPDVLHYIYPDPFKYVDIEHEFKAECNIQSELIDKFLTVNFNDEPPDNPEISLGIRRKYITRLVVLWRYGLLSDEQTNIFSTLLWTKRKLNGFPASTDYYEFAFITFPYPETLNQPPIQLLKDHINQTDISFDSASLSICGIKITRGHSTIVQNILATQGKSFTYQWDKESINNLLLKIIQWWNSDKKYLKEKHNKSKDDSVVNEFKARFTKMISLFHYIFSPNIEKVDVKYIGDIKLLLSELPEYKMNDLTAITSFFKLFPDREEHIISRIENQLLSQEEEKTIDALNAVLVLLKQNNQRITGLIGLIFQSIKFRPRKCLIHFLTTAIIIIKSHSHYLSESMIDDVNIGLAQLLDELKIDDEDDVKCIHEKLQCRLIGIELLHALKSYYNVNNLEIPPYMNQWEDCCLNKDEFSEIRNAWKNAVT